MSRSQRQTALARDRKAALVPQIIALRLQRLPMAEIGRRLGIVKSTVSIILKEQREEWNRENKENAAELFTLLSAEYVTVKNEALAAWERSKKNKVTKTTDLEDMTAARVDDSDVLNEPIGQKRKRSKKVECQTGDASFLNAAMKAMEGLRDLWGLDAAKKTELYGPEGGPVLLSAVRTDDLRNMTDEQLARIEMEIATRIGTEGAGETEFSSVHPVRVPGISGELASPIDCGTVGEVEDARNTPVDDLCPAATREIGNGESETASVHFGPQPECPSAVMQLCEQPSDQSGNEGPRDDGQRPVQNPLPWHAIMDAGL